MSGLERRGGRRLGWPQCRSPKESEEQIPSCLSCLKLPGESGKGSLGGSEDGDITATDGVRVGLEKR